MHVWQLASWRELTSTRDHLLDTHIRKAVNSGCYVNALLPDHNINIMLAMSKMLENITEIGRAAFGEHCMD